MNAALILVVLGTVAAGIAWLVLRQRRIDRERHFDRRVHARKLGWTYDDARAGPIDYRFSGAGEGVAWQMWYDSDRGDEAPTPRAHWQSTNVRTPALALVIIGRRRFDLESGVVGQVLFGVVGGIAQAMTGADSRPDKSGFYESAIDLKEGSTAFRERYAIAVAPDMPRGWVDEELQSLLMRWPSKTGPAFRGEDSLEVTLGAGGLRVVAQRMPEDFAYWQQLARLGEHLARRLIASR
jgi:hypothetical protein